MNAFFTLLKWLCIAAVVLIFIEDKHGAFFHVYICLLLLAIFFHLQIKSPPTENFYAQAERAEFKGERDKAIGFYLDEIYTIKNSPTSDKKRIPAIEEKITSLGGVLPYKKE